jgi:putative ABC transport system permease protein
MLRLKNITKKYVMGDSHVDALKGISLSFRKTEFVSILGPSGCGKTTMLNIIGGLDKYTSGDLYISGKSTKDFKDRDWDVYRNHRVGFIFQSYNLIPHQTILGNVELALTISGVSKKEKTERAMKVLDRVGLKGLYKKKPNQLSGGQCQRVAIARALVNEPEILLADEPTGALDTQTSIQIMDLIKEIAKERLVIMVTHNPELAEKYSTRIIRLLDGLVQDDSNPFNEDDEIKEVKNLTPIDPTKEKAKMSIATATKLSAQNLWSKRKRTALVSIAGSIGIVGVSLVLAISSGIHGYIDTMQDDLLSGNPITIKESSYDMSSLMNSSTYESKVKDIIIEEKLNVNKVIQRLMDMQETQSSILVQNTITEDYVQFVKDMPSDYASAVQFGYGIDPTNNIYTSFKVSEDSSEEYRSLSSIVRNYEMVIGETDYKDLTSYISMFEDTFQEAPGNKDYIASQYDVVTGKIATEPNEIMVVMSKKQSVADITLGELGYYTQDQMLNVAYDAADDDHYDEKLAKYAFDYSEILNKKFTYYPNSTIYKLNPNYSAMSAATSGETQYTYNYLKDDSFTSGYELKVVGILQPKDNISYGCLESGFYYTKGFTDYMLENSKDSAIATYCDEQAQVYKDRGYDVGGASVKFDLNYINNNGESKTSKASVGKSNSYASFISMMSSMMGGSTSQSSGIGRILTSRHVAGNDLANDISIYPVNFEIKDKVTSYLDKWNEEEDITLSTGKVLAKDARSEIKYADNVGLIINMINTMIDIVSYALIAFTALSLLVSTVMIGIITYVSVVERVKEIGVIRSLGGRKRDVSNLFIAETVMIGLGSGIIGILITYLDSIVLNVIMQGLIGFNIAALPILSAIIMIVISVLLTLISGVIPARAAAKKDPVVALRTE